ncbi:ABC transporter permease [Paenibacillus sepulcri]|uniref:ABC transporter permease subunit n=1 Tax=Paenibacillus sepulcri TaxID=359917 RepID=A0ABS7BVS2_9BACL|nr:ABC transporter permease subunit [Paenibacillus sepulcri]
MTGIQNLLSKLKKQKVLMLMLIPFLAHLLLFKYYPMYGNLIAFKDYSFSKGIIGSPWAGFKWFEYFFNSSDFWIVMRNTVVISVLSLIFTTAASIVFAILVCELRNLYMKKFVQTVSYLPHFISWVVVAGMAFTLFSIDGGSINKFLVDIHVIDKPVNFLGDEQLYWPVITFLNVWKSAGYNSILYIAAITAIDRQMYESAIIDGANKWKQIIYITLPCIKPTIVILLVLSLGYVLNAGLDQQFFMGNPLNMEHSQVLDTYIVRYGLQQLEYSYGTAVGLFRSIISLVLVVIANMISRRLFKMGVF